MIETHETAGHVSRISRFAWFLIVAFRPVQELKGDKR